MHYFVWMLTYVRILADLILQVDSKNTSFNILSLYQDGSGLPTKNDYTDDDLLLKYRTAIFKSFIAVFGDSEAEKFKSLSREVVEFEMELKTAEPDPEDKWDETIT